MPGHLLTRHVGPLVRLGKLGSEADTGCRGSWSAKRGRWSQILPGHMSNKAASRLELIIWGRRMVRVSPNPHSVHLPLSCLRLSREETAVSLTDVEGTGLDGDAGHREAGRGDDRPGSGAKHFDFDKGGCETHKQRLVRITVYSPKLKG